MDGTSTIEEFINAVKVEIKNKELPSRLEDTDKV
jgi:hypothetical protein